MRIQVNGKHIDIGEALREHVETNIEACVEKYSVRPVEANVTFSKDRFEFICDLSVHLSTGLTANSKAKASEIYEAFENALEKMEKQLRRHKRRLKNHHNERTTPIEFDGAPSYILSPNEENDQESNDSLQPLVVAEMETKVKFLTVGEAVLEMELSHLPLLVFRNMSHGGVNVVYQREDGNVGWIDPKSNNQ